MRIAVKFVLLLLAVLAVLVALLAFNTLTTHSRQLQVAPAEPIAVDERAAAAHLAATIQFQTIASATDAQQNLAEFQRLHGYLANAFPLVHRSLQRELINDSSLLFTWQGSDSNAAAIVLMAHQDVVPIAPGTEADWLHPPFSGQIAEGFVWGRGAWDDKGNLIAQLTAVEALLSRQFVPTRTIYLVFGADEEVSGERGAKTIAAQLNARGVRAEFVLDEGMLITDGMIAGLDAPAALIGIAEKGYLSATLSVAAEPGHSSMPPRDNSAAIPQLSAILQRLYQHELPARIDGVARQLFETLGPEMHGLNRVALTNLWVFEPLVKAQLTNAPGTNAMLRTTTAFTMLNAGNKDNVLPGRADATINFRLLPGTGSDEVLAHVAQHAGAIAGQRFELKKLPGGSEASPVSSTDSVGYRAIETTLRELLPNTLVAPGLMLGASDSRHFSLISEQIFRFSPIHAKPADLARFHGSNERLAVADLATMIRFYQRLLEQTAGTAAAPP